MGGANISTMQNTVNKTVEIESFLRASFFMLLITSFFEHKNAKITKKQ